MVSMYELPADNQNDLDLPESSAESVEPHQVLADEENNMVAWRHNGWLHFLVSEIAPNQLAQIAREGRYYLANGQNRGYNGPVVMPASGQPLEVKP
jgi:hypothetical protein